jgi:tetratricopeptide (TPR) repeat protein
MVFMSSGFTDKAVQYFNEAFKLDGDSITHYYVMASLAFCTENFKRAVEYLDRAYKMYPENNTLLWNLGLYNMFAGQPEESLKFFKGLDSGDILTEGILFGSHRIGWAYWMNGEKEKAEYYFNEQIRYCNQMKEQGRVYGNNSRIFYDLAAVYAFLGERDKAYENLRSIDLDDFVAGLWTLSLVRHDPLLNSLRNDREFQQILLDVQTKYEEDHEKLRKWLEENKML